jgi:hypothetical protein
MFSGCIIVGSLFTLDEVVFLERGFAIASLFLSSGVCEMVMGSPVIWHPSRELKGYNRLSDIGHVICGGEFHVFFYFK